MERWNIMSAKKSSNLLALLLVLAIFISAVIILSIKSPQVKNLLTSMGKPSPTTELNEDELSMYEIPQDVQQALNLSKTENRPVMGLRTDGPRYHIPILMYHYIEHVKDKGDKVRISLNILPEVLDAQINTLIKANYNFITASEFADILDGIKPPPPKPVMFTFDDGYRDFYTDAFPILKKYNVKVTNYVISGFTSNPNHLTQDQIAELAKSGLVEIGAHTVDHIALKGSSQNVAAQEIVQSKLQIERIVGFPITAFAYPYGSFDLQAIQLVKQTGFRTAVSTLEGRSQENSQRYFAPRLRPGAATGQALISLLEKE